MTRHNYSSQCFRPSVRLFSTALKLIAFVTATAPWAMAGSVPTGLKCPVDYTLKIRSNVLTCEKLLTSGTILDARPPTCAGKGGTVIPQPGVDACPIGGKLTCPADYILKTDASGTTDSCVHYGYDFQPPTQG